MSLRAKSLMTPTPEMLAKEALPKPPLTVKRIAAIRSDVIERLAPFDRKAQQQRGLTKTLAKQKSG